MYFNDNLTPSPFDLPRDDRFRGGTYYGHQKNNVPHGFGFFYYEDTRNHQSIIYCGTFESGQEHGDGLMIHPCDGSISYATYHHGKLLETSPKSPQQLNDILLKQMSTMCVFLYHSQDDLNIEKKTVEQVNSALVSAQDKNDKLIQLLHSTPGVDINQIEAIMNPPHPRNTVRALNMDELLREDEDVLADILGEDEDMLDDTDDNNSTDDNESDEDYSDNDDDDDDYVFMSSDDDDDE